MSRRSTHRMQNLENILGYIIHFASQETVLINLSKNSFTF